MKRIVIYFALALMLNIVNSASCGAYEGMFEFYSNFIMFHAIDSDDDDFHDVFIIYNPAGVYLQEKGSDELPSGFDADIVIPEYVSYRGSETNYVKRTYKVVGISKEAFYSYPLNYATSVTLPNTLRTIGDNGLGGFQRLKSLRIPESVYQMGPQAVWGYELETVTIPNSLYSVSYHFIDGAKLQTIVSYIQDPDIINYSMDSHEVVEPFSQEVLENVTLIVPTGTLEKYRASTVFGGFVNIVEQDLDVDAIELPTKNNNVTDDAIYDLQGCHVQTPQRGGVYIKNGRKFLQR